MAEPVTWVAAASLAMNGVGQVMGAHSQAAAAEKDAAMKRMQASELLDRAAQNAETYQRQGDKLRGQQVNALASSGVDVGSGSSLTLMEETAHEVTRQITNMNREAQFKADMLNRGADVSMDLAADRELAGWLGAGGSVLGGYAMWNKAMDKKVGGPIGIKEVGP